MVGRIKKQATRKDSEIKMHKQRFLVCWQPESFQGENIERERERAPEAAGTDCVLFRLVLLVVFVKWETFGDKIICFILPALIN